MELQRQHRVAIIGAGPAGVHMAHLLRRRGFERVTVLERTEQIGGRLQTVEHDGLPHEVGACYLSSSYSTVRALIEEYGGGPLVKPGGRDGGRDMYSSHASDGGEEPRALDTWLLSTYVCLS